MSRIKKLFITFITVLMIVGILPTNKLLAVVDESNATCVVTLSNGEEHYYDSIYNAFSYANDHTDCTIKLLADFNISSTLQCNDRYTLDLNGHTIDGQGKTRLINVNARPGRRYELTVDDTSSEKNGRLINGRVNGNYGGAFYVQGTLNLKGGTVENCSSGWDGGAVIVSEGARLLIFSVMPSGIFNMSGGTIKNCTADMGGAVIIEAESEMNMSGGLITGCKARTKGGAVMLVGSKGVFNMSGGIIDSCHADTFGGGVNVHGETEFHMSGGIIQNCTAPEGGGVMIEEGYTTVEHEAPLQHFGGLARLSGGTITKNRATINGGGVYLHGFDANIFTAQITSDVKLAGDINIIDNTGPAKRDGTNQNNLFIGTYPKMDRDTPYMTVENNLTGTIGISTTEIRRLSYTSSYGNQSSHFVSDYRCWQVTFHNDNRYYLEWRDPDIVSAKLVTPGMDNSQAMVNIDKTAHTITIYAGREIDLDTMFGMEVVSVDWIGVELVEKSGDQRYVYTTTPHEVKIFHYAAPTKYYSEYITLSMGDAGRVFGWNIYVYGIGSKDPEELKTISTDVYVMKDGDYVKKEPESITKNARGNDVYHYHFFPGMGLKLVPQEKKDGKIFYNWHAYPNIIEDALKAPAYLQMPDHYLNVEAKYVYPYEINYRVDVINGKAYRHGTTDQLFYTNPETQVDIKADVPPTGKIFTMWSSDGYTLTDEQRYSKEFTFKMPYNDVKFIANYEDEIKSKYTAYKIVDGQQKEVITSADDVTQYTNINLSAPATVGLRFMGWTTSDSSVDLKQDGYSVSFKMPRRNIELYANYFTDHTDFNLKLINTNKDGDSGRYLCNAKITGIKANIPEDKEFVEWVFYQDDRVITDKNEIKKIVSNWSTANLGTIVMPSYNLTVEAKLKDKEYKLTQIETCTSGETKQVKGDIIYIRPLIKIGYQFYKWKINDSEEIPSYITTEEDGIKLVMPSQNVKVEATYKQDGVVPHRLTRLHTDNDGTSYYYPSTQNIVINSIPSEVFKNWKFFDGNDVEISYNDFKQYITSDENNGHLRITMPDFDVKVVGEYNKSLDRYLLTKVNTKNDGTIELASGKTESVQIIDGKELEKWLFYKDGEEVEESVLETYISYSDPGDKSHFTFTMPEANITIKAKYKDEDAPTTYTLEQVGTIHEGKTIYKAGTENIPINSKGIFEKAFNGWEIYKVEGETEIPLTGDALETFKTNYVTDKAYYDSGAFTLKMPDYNLKIVATFKDEPQLVPHDLIQVKTVDEGVTSLYKDTAVQIEALNFIGAEFDKFNIYDCRFSDVKPLNGSQLEDFISKYITGGYSSGAFTLKMPDYSVKIEACYKQSPISYMYTLTQENTIDARSKDYYESSKIYIQAIKMTGAQFDGWSFYRDNGKKVSPESLSIVGDVNTDSFYLYMPNFNLKVVANFKADPSILPNKLEQVRTANPGVSEKFAGTRIELRSAPTLGGVFDSWKFFYLNSGEEITNPRDIITIDGDLTDEVIYIFMPNFDLKVEATYREDEKTLPYTLTQVLTKAEGSRDCYGGTNVYIQALPLLGATFKEFKFYKYNADKQEIEITDSQFLIDHVKYKDGDHFTLVMPEYDLKVVATYNGLTSPYELIQEKTLDEGTSYHLGGEQNIEIEAQAFLDGEFKEFSFYKVTPSGDIKIDESKLKITYVNEGNKNNHIKLEMPSYDLKVVSEYEEITLYRLTQINTSEILPKYSAVTLVNDGDRVTASYSGSLGGTFKEWSIIDSDTKEDISSKITITSGSITTSPISFTMPKRNVTIEAIGEGIPRPMKLAIVKGYLLDGSGDIIEPVDIKDDTYIYYEKPKTSLEASFNSSYVSLGGLTFDKWRVNKSSLIIGSPTGITQEFNMPEEDVELECLLKDGSEQLHFLNVVNGGARIDKELIPFDEYHDSTHLNVEAYVELGAEFDHWLFYRYEEQTPSGLLKATPTSKIVRRELTSTEMESLGISPNNPKLSFNMPSYDLEFVALFKVNQVKLKVIDGYIDDLEDGHIEEKTYVEGFKPTICANVPNGYSFSHWEIVDGNPIMPEGGINRGRTSLVIRGDVTMKAHFTKKYSPPPTGVK